MNAKVKLTRQSLATKCSSVRFHLLCTACCYQESKQRSLQTSRVARSSATKYFCKPLDAFHKGYIWMEVCRLAQALAANQHSVKFDVEVMWAIAKPHEESVSVAIMTLVLELFNDHVVDWS